MRAPITAIALLLAAPAALCQEGFQITRRAAGDSFAMAEAELGGKAIVSCRSNVRRPAPGAEVSLRIEPDKARRDEGSFSLILRSDEERVIVVFHEPKTYSELPFPIQKKKLQSEYVRLIVKSAPELVQLQIEGEVKKGQEMARDRKLEFREARVGNQMGKTYRVRAGFSEDLEAVPPIGFELEVLAQRLRLNGEAWLPRLHDRKALPFFWEQNLQQPETEVRYREEVVEIRVASFPPETFAPPAGYKKVPYEPSCLASW